MGGRSGASFTGEAWRERPHCVADHRGSELCSPTGESLVRTSRVSDPVLRRAPLPVGVAVPLSWFSLMNRTVRFSPGLCTGVTGLFPVPSHPPCACLQPAGALELGSGAGSQPGIPRAWCCILQRLSVSSSGAGCVPGASRGDRGCGFILQRLMVHGEGWSGEAGLGFC